MKNKTLKAPRLKNKVKGRVYAKQARIVEDSKPQQEKKKLINGYIDPDKVFHGKVDKAIRKRISRMRNHFALPSCIQSLRTPYLSDVLVINHPGRTRELLPDVPPRHVMLCHHSLARVIESGIGIFTEITSDTDGHWALCPAGVDMLNQTTVQHVRRRPFWFLRRYGYEISFDGRVEPPMMLARYDIDPTRQKQRFYVSYERVKIKDSEKYNSFFRFWRNKPPKASSQWNI